MQPQNNQQQQQQQKAMIYIENLDQGISEDYLYRKFKEIGEIQSLKIAKDKTTQKSKGQAYITFANPDSAEEARKMFNNAVFIKNIIRVKAYFNYHNADKKANIFINSLPEDADTLELEQEFSRFGTVLSVDIHRDQHGKSLNYGYVQFEKKEEADNLMREVATKPFIYKTKVLKLESFKAQSERKTESAAIYLRAFARPLNEAENADDKVLKAIEYAWQLIIKDYFLKQKAEVKDCFVKIDKFTRQPWAMIQFNCPDQAKDNLEICEKQRFHPCIKGSAAKALELLHKLPPPSTSDGVPQFELQEVRSFFEEQTQSHQDVFLGQSENFFYNQVYSKHLNPDDRLILVQNIKDDVTKEEIEQFLGAFGKVIRLTIRKTKNPRFQVQQCFVHYQTMEDSKRARSEVYDDSNTKVVALRSKIFKDGHVMMNILLSKAVRKEYKEIKKNSQSIFQSPQGRILLQPNQPYMPQMAPPPFAQRPGQGGQQMMPRPPPFNRIPYDPNRRQYGGKPQFQQFPQQMGQQMQQLNPMQMQMNPMGQQMGYPPRQPQNNYMQQGGQRYPQQQPQFPGPYPMPIQQNFPLQMPPVQQKFNPLDKFQDYATIVEYMNEFNQLQAKVQRDILGNLLVFKIATMTSEQDLVNRIVGMLIEETSLEISEILGFFEDERELQERINEALELLHQEQNDSQP